MEEQIAALVKSVNEGRPANDARLEAIQTSLELWRPAVTNLQHQLDELRTQVGRIALHPALADPVGQEGDPAADPMARSPAAPMTPGGTHHGPEGHGNIIDSGGSAHGVVTTLAPPPVKGASLMPSLEIPAPASIDLTREHGQYSPHSPHHNWSLPRLEFPPFDGDNPQFWKARCEKYFDVYGIQKEMWVRVASLHFSGNAARWLQIYEAQHASFTWEELCSAMGAKFGREQYQAQLRQFNSLRQAGSVAEYMEQFEELMHHLLAHNAAFDPLFFTTQFIDGLKIEIKDGVALHRPQDLDSAFSLASLQEELLASMPRRDHQRHEQGVPRAPVRPLLAAGAPPPRAALPAPQGAAEDRRALDAARAPDHRHDQGRGQDRVAALCNYRRARGLCFKCGERWGQGHQCAAMVQLHVVEELWELLQAEEQDRQGHQTDEEQVMCISKMATTGETTPRTVRLLGMLDGIEVLILVDSGSSHSFISEAVATRMKDRIQPIPSIAVKIANGGILQCSGIIPRCSWKTQGQQFVTYVRVHSLGCYDMVVGMDWLEQCGPMLVDWAAKTLQFDHEGRQVVLQGLQAKTSQVQQVDMAQLLALESNNSIAHIVVLYSAEQSEGEDPIPAELQQIVDAFPEVFAEPTELPEHRSWDHSIPLIPGANPINIRPYRYTPEQKDEIEAQVKEMLRLRLIVPSNSPFSSPVLLVKKKDQTWRFALTSGTSMLSR